MQVLGTYKEFKKFMGKNKLNSKTLTAIKVYLNTGGVLKVENKKPLKVIYPSKNRLKDLLVQTEDRERYINGQIAICNRELAKITTNGVVTQASKIINPTYWQHLVQMGVDNQYRKDFTTASLPMEMMHIPRYKKIIEMFITNPEYRERLIEARTSELGKLRRTIKESARKAENFKKNTVNVRIKKLEKEGNKIQKRKKAIKVLIGASSRFF